MQIRIRSFRIHFRITAWPRKAPVSAVEHIQPAERLQPIGGADCRPLARPGTVGVAGRVQVLPLA